MQECWYEGWGVETRLQVHSGHRRVVNASDNSTLQHQQGGSSVQGYGKSMITMRLEAQDRDLVRELGL